MSVVIVTPTHIACDHCVVLHERPTKVIIDRNHFKFFVSPDNTFVYGISGEFDPEEISSDNYFQYIREIFRVVLSHHSENRNFGSVLVDNKRFKDIDKMNEFLKKHFKELTSFLLVSKTHKFCVHAADTSDKGPSLFFKSLGDFNAIGICQGYAMGLLIGGDDLKTTFEKLSHMSPLVSAEFSSFELSNLSDIQEI